MSKYDDPDEIYDREIEVEALTMRLADVIQETLEAQGLSRADLARILGVSKAHITQTLSGQRNLTLKTVAEALHALDSRLKVEVTPLRATPSDGQDVAAHLGGARQHAESTHQHSGRLRADLQWEQVQIQLKYHERWDQWLRRGGQEASSHGVPATQAIHDSRELAAHG
jgi:transcriptional regulator with XRE-family HTH domain